MKQFALIGAVLLAACTLSAARLSVLTPESVIQGEAVQRATIRVNAPFTFRPALYSATYPAGLYIPQFEDDDGVFFRAQDQILAQTVAGGRTMLGGIYVSKESWSRYQAYVDENGSIYKFDIPFEIDMTVLRQQ